MRILITGGAGYIGSILVPELLRLGNEVIVIDNFMYNQSPLLDCCHYETLTLIRGMRETKILFLNSSRKLMRFFHWHV